MSTTARRRLTIGAATAVSAVLLLAACAPADSAPDGSSPSGGSVDGPPLSVASVSAPNSLDPAQLTDGQQALVWASIYDTLLTRDNETAELRPGAAESWEYNEDGTELTLTLRPDMTFSNGNPVNAEAVAGTMRRTMQTPGIVQPKYALVSDAVAEDDLTVKVIFTEFDPQFTWNLALGAGVVADPSTFDSPELTTNPVGSGPFTLDTASTVPGTSYVLERRDDYRAVEEVPFPKMTVRVLQDPTASFNALQAGEVNAASVRAQFADQLDPNSYTFTDISNSSLLFLDILDRGGEKWPALGDVRVRQAINYALDRESMVSGIYGGAAEPAEQIFIESGQVYDAELDGQYPYDPELGKRLVEESGFAGETFQIPSTYLTTTIEPTLSQAFADIGLGLEWVPVPPQQAQSALTSGDFGLAFQALGPNSDPADAFYHFAPSGFGNPRGYTNETLDGFFDVINTTVDFDEALPAYRGLNEYAIEQAYVAPVVWTSTKWATTDGIEVIGTAPQTFRIFGYTD
ncbi:ABC transporter substrate-binding protein [Microbacterium sp.]|uniref:ABC transporter substrate-binding protein n=1 Tax=Microbacterium sp. TaxID=51671 RepID=UPI0027323DD7|nr:ABC transporter substrate-binding protein [Microbacterium sp.]MDP3949787.1 ABC transporter substrate-binding protein [Microbacterium sp.]